MKIPFEFGIKLIFRLLFPGVILTLGVMPVLRTVVDYGHWGDSLEYVLGFTVVFLGWLVTVSDMPIYMLFEGRRFWPPPLFRFFTWREQRRLARHLDVVRLHETGVLERMQKYAARARERLSESGREDETGPEFEKVELVERAVRATLEKRGEAYFDLRTFPLLGKDYEDYAAERPTRLGNLMAAYERYSLRAYGMDSVFYWYRIWLLVDKGTREEVDNSQALADSTVYTSFALFCSGLLWLAYAGSIYTRPFISSRLPSLAAALPEAPVTVFDHLPGLRLSLLIATAFVAGGFGVYRIALRLHAQYGELFKSVFDVYAPKVDFQAATVELNGILAGARSAHKLNGKKRAEIVTRYLQYNRIRCPYPKAGTRPEDDVPCGRLLKPSAAEEHFEKVHPQYYKKVVTSPP